MSQWYLFCGPRKGGVNVRSLIIGGAAVLGGVALAAATTIGVVHSATSGSFQPKSSVLQYGSNG
jgi:hypothetical protein